MYHYWDVHYSLLSVTMHSEVKAIISFVWKVIINKVRYCQVWWPILEICALHLTHPSPHTQQWVVNKHTHTLWTRTRSSGQPLLQRPGGAIGGSVPCSRASQSWYWRWRESCSFTIPTSNSCWCENRTSDLQVTSQTLTIRPQLPHKYWISLKFLM